MLIVFEITGDYNVTLAVMIASAVSSLFTNVLYKQSYFHLQLANRGIHLEGGRATYLLKSARVADHMSRDFFTINHREPLETASELLIAQDGGILIVTDNAGMMTGILSFSDIPSDIHSNETEQQKTAGDVARHVPRKVMSLDPLQLALARLENSGEDILPVLSSQEKGIVVGIIKHRDIIREYNRALLDSQGRGNS
jgi:CIC family chloride channel protein